ncbi:MAG: transcription termination/antitermination NusG family protein [Verrucomicrobiota bacterium]|nr:transcription termination/antitermination NusG family protein [Verrucomicrobiota bacterium]
MLTIPPAISLESAFFDLQDMDWETCSYYVIHSKPRQEKKSALMMAQLTRPSFLPLYKKAMERKSGSSRIRRYESLIPVFAGYLFGRLDHNDLKISHFNETVAHFIIVKPPETAHFIFQLDQLRRALASEYTIAPYENFEKGALVKITSGSLKGMEGYVVELKEKQTFVIEIDMVGRAVSIDIDASFLKKVH